jgi:hypothetical protein
MLYLGIDQHVRQITISLRLEVCGFNDWLIRMLCDYRCTKAILIQPPERKRRKTDRRRVGKLVRT